MLLDSNFFNSPPYSSHALVWEIVLWHEIVRTTNRNHNIKTFYSLFTGLYCRKAVMKQFFHDIPRQQQVDNDKIKLLLNTLRYLKREWSID